MPSEKVWTGDDAPPAKHVCEGCQKRVTVRPDQFGRRLRCPHCQTAFVVAPTQASAAKPRPEKPGMDADPAAVEAGELARPAAPRSTRPAATGEFATARFGQPATVVYEAAIYAVRHAGGEVLSLDRTNLNVRFAVGGGALHGEHVVYVFPGPTGGSELDIRPVVSAGGFADRLLYGRIGAEILSYLDARDAHERATRPPAVLPPAVEPPVSRRRRRRETPVDAFAICGFIASLVGLVLFCFPLGAIPAALVGSGLSVFSLTQPRGQRGLAIAGLAIGVVAALLAGIIFLIAVEAEMARRNASGR